MRVYVDESVHTDVGLCALAAVAVEIADEPQIRADLQALLPPGARRLKWNSDSPALRAKSTQVVAQYARQARVYLGYFDANKRQDDARERCLAHLYEDLGNNPPFQEIVLDKRSPAQDTRDLVVMSNSAVRLQLRNPPGYRHDGTHTEALLWLADTLAGAACEHLVKHDPSYVQTLASKLVIS